MPDGAAKRAAIHQLKDRLFVHPWQITDMGVGIASEPYVALPLEADAASLGKAALEALDQSGRTVRHPSDWKAQAAPRLKVAGAKSEKAFQTRACYVSIELDGSQFLVEPSRNGGTTGDKKGFTPLPDLRMAIKADSAAVELGNTIRKALQLSHEQSGF
jgi:hypothetical protein